MNSNYNKKQFTTYNLSFIINSIFLKKIYYTISTFVNISWDFIFYFYDYGVIVSSQQLPQVIHKKKRKKKEKKNRPYYHKLYSFWAAGPTKRLYDPTPIKAKNILFNVLDTFNTEHHQHIYKLIYIQNSYSHTTCWILQQIILKIW